MSYVYLFSDATVIKFLNGTQVYIINLKAPDFVFSGPYSSEAFSLWYLSSQAEARKHSVCASVSVAYNDGLSLAQTSSVIAQVLNYFGVGYVYVDDGMLNFVGSLNGSSYNAIFSSSGAFTKLINDGTVTVYKNNLYGGVVSSFAAEDYDLVKSNLTQYLNKVIEGGVMPNLSTEPIRVSQLNDQSYRISLLDRSASQIVVLKTQYNEAWTLLLNGRVPDNDHFVSFGYSNGWIVPANTSYVTIVYRGAKAYAFTEVFLLAIPFVFLLTFSFIEVKQRLAAHRRQVT
jgi:hypothetical protein